MKLEDFMDEFSVLECKDNYGPDMVESSLADWLELAALRGVRAPWNTIVGSWQDVGLPEARRSGVIDEGEAAPEELEVYNLALDEIKIREGYLGDEYPFHVDSLNCVELKPGYDIRSSFYIDLLIVSLLKGFACCDGDGVLKPTTTYFELLVDECLRASVGEAACPELFRSAVMGTSVEGNFNERLKLVASELGIIADPTAAPRSSSAQDDKVDVVCGIVWGDSAKSDSLMLIQATCCKSMKWSDKLYAIHANKWSSYLGEKSVPRTALAVPYRMTPGAIRRVFDEPGYRTFFDRVRLVKMASGNSVVYRSSLVQIRPKIIELASTKLRIDVE